MQQEAQDSIIVVLIRIRPLNEREQLEKEQYSFRIDEDSKNTLIFDASTRNDAKTFTFDHVCPEQVSQDEVFRLIGIPTAKTCLQGNII